MTSGERSETWRSSCIVIGSWRSLVRLKTSLRQRSSNERVMHSARTLMKNESML